jgi:Fanconi anemia group J protein
MPKMFFFFLDINLSCFTVPWQQHTLHVKGVQVDFPIKPESGITKPYGTQRQVIVKIISALQEGKHALIESPTGSGKSLALLTATLAWQKKCVESQNVDSPTELQFLSKPTHKHVTIQYENDNKLVPDNLLPSGEDPERVCHTSVPTIYYTARTHGQLKQLISEFKKTSYSKTIHMSVMGGKSHLCIHHEAEDKKRNRDDLEEFCYNLNRNDGEKKCKACQDQGGSSSYHTCKGCPYKAKSKDVAVKVPLDLEEWNVLGRREQFCPFYAIDENVKQAQVIFCPYDYLINPIYREAKKIKLKNSIVVIDEAHNIEQKCMEALSDFMPKSQLTRAAKEYSKLCSYFEKKDNQDKVAPEHQDDFKRFADSSRVLHQANATLRQTILRNNITN